MDIIYYVKKQKIKVVKNMIEDNIIFRIIRRILNIFNKTLYLQESQKNCELDNAYNKENVLHTKEFIENTYEINCWQSKIENGTVKVEELPLNLKLRIIVDYDKKIEQLEFEKSFKLKRLQNSGIKIGD